MPSLKAVSRKKSRKVKPEKLQTVPSKPLTKTEILKCEMCLVMTTGSQIHAALKKVTDSGKKPYPYAGDEKWIKYINNSIALLKAADQASESALDAWCESLTPAQRRMVGPLASRAERGTVKREAAKAGQGVSNG